ncbi:hypothetical protein [Methylophaga thiooxydans]|uniref:hypothetical protein n=1 Tax=Methylophaga thiooxydans TaxID=392484 RepID=UPI0023538CE0|nr:hypothetical protein [Methylophaga thiooxydans]
MQINSNRPADYYPISSADGRNNSRLPVVFDATTEQLKPVVSKERADNTTVVLPTTSNQDSQQARFVRDFFASDRQLSSSIQQQPLLPAAVQQYLLVDDIPNQKTSAQGQFLDEMV